MENKDSRNVESGEETIGETSIASLAPKKKAKATAICLVCGHRFDVNRPWQRFCSPKCRQYRWEKEHPRIGVVRKSIA